MRPAQLPEGVSEDDLVIAYYDEETETWVDLVNIVIDRENHTVIGKVDHFTIIAIQVKVSVPTEEPTEKPIEVDDSEILAEQGVDPEPVMLIAPLTFEYESLIGTKIWVAGYYGDGSHTADGVGFLLDNYIRLIANE